MKNVIVIIVEALIGALMLVMGMTIYGRVNRSMEITGGLSAAVEKTIDNLAAEKKYDIDDADEYIADMAQSLSHALDADTDVRVDITGADKERGILGMKVTASYLHPNGNTGTLTFDKTVVLDGEEERAPEGSYTVSFYLTKEDLLADTNCYKKSMVLSGDVPAVPALPGGTYAGWKDRNDDMADFSVPVTQEQSYYAYE